MRRVLAQAAYQFAAMLRDVVPKHGHGGGGVMPERLIWGFGDGSTMPVYDTPIGKIGAVVCWENYMPLMRAAHYAKGVQLYPAPTADGRDTWLATVRHIACRRGPLLPDVPTIAEAGLPGYQVLGAFEVVAPAGTPQDVVNRLNKEISEIVNIPDVRQKLLAHAATPERQTPAEFAHTLKSEVAKWAKIVDATGVRLD